MGRDGVGVRVRMRRSAGENAGGMTEAQSRVRDDIRCDRKAVNRATHAHRRIAGDANADAVNDRC